MNPRQPTDFPIARGVSPPPRQIHRRPPPRRADTVVERPLIRPVIVRKPAVGRRKPILAVEIGVVVVLSGFCMAAGWWLFHDHGSPTRPVAVREGEAPAEPRAQPARQESRPPGPIKIASNTSATPVPKREQPIAPPPPPNKPGPPPTMLTFQNDIRPILQAKCALCHGERNKLKGGLDVRTLRSLEKGGDSGRAINREQPELSPLWETVSTGQMPPGKNSKLSESERKKLHDWLLGGGK